MLYIICIILVTIFFLLIKRSNKLFSLIISLDLFAIALLMFSLVLHIIRITNYDYTYQFEYRIYKLLAGIHISYFDIVTIINISVCIFLISQNLLFLYNISYSRHKQLKLIFSIAYVILILVAFLYFNSTKLREILYIRTNYYNSRSALVLQSCINALNRVLLFSGLIIPIIQIFADYLHTDMIAKKIHTQSLLILSVFVNLIFVTFITLTPIRSLIGSLKIYSFEDYSSVLYYDRIIMVFICLIIAALVVCFNFDTINDKIFNPKYPNHNTTMLLAKDIRHIFHSYKNALFSIKVLTENAIDNYGTEAGLESLQNIKSKTDIFTVNANHFLDIYNNFDISYNSISIEQCVDDACLLSGTSSSVQISKTYTAPDVNFYGDRELITEAFVNLLTNATDAILKKGAGTGKIEIRIFTEIPWICVSIKDNGIGIEKKYRRKIFEPFFSTKQTFNNWGIGLSYTKNIILAHSGNINLRSRPGKFTEFQVTLPMDI